MAKKWLFSKFFFLHLLPFWRYQASQASDSTFFAEFPDFVIHKLCDGIKSRYFNLNSYKFKQFSTFSLANSSSFLWFTSFFSNRFLDIFLFFLLPCFPCRDPISFCLFVCFSSIFFLQLNLDGSAKFLSNIVHCTIKAHAWNRWHSCEMKLRLVVWTFT